MSAVPWRCIWSVLELKECTETKKSVLSFNLWIFYLPDWLVVNRSPYKMINCQKNKLAAGETPSNLVLSPSSSIVISHLLPPALLNMVPLGRILNHAMQPICTVAQFTNCPFISPAYVDRHLFGLYMPFMKVYYPNCSNKKVKSKTRPKLADTQFPDQRQPWFSSGVVCIACRFKQFECTHKISGNAPRSLRHRDSWETQASALCARAQIA